MSFVSFLFKSPGAHCLLILLTFVMFDFVKCVRFIAWLPGSKGLNTISNMRFLPSNVNFSMVCLRLLELLMLVQFLIAEW